MLSVAMQLVCSLALLFLVCGVPAAYVAAHKQAAGTGFLLGVLFGPLGVIAAFAADHRPRCPRCAGRLDGDADGEQKPELCRWCLLELDWGFGKPRAMKPGAGSDDWMGQAVQVSEADVNRATGGGGRK